MFLYNFSLRYISIEKERAFGNCRLSLHDIMYQSFCESVGLVKKQSHPNIATTQLALIGQTRRTKSRERWVRVDRPPTVTPITARS